MNSLLGSAVPTEVQGARRTSSTKSVCGVDTSTCTKSLRLPHRKEYHSVRSGNSSCHRTEPPKSNLKAGVFHTGDAISS
ncbi:hypothetical protein TNCV_1812161 [Trichonephila clavipes]|uniref:Uncharacterized protein n=1 Tax=Trichonephila clavipes TaxID=2585209 RepID=A0A8X6W8M1_TRICX|nr:hypothetical protein TNCV_1812161 [Trichonephila clavipes]